MDENIAWGSITAFLLVHRISACSVTFYRYIFMNAYSVTFLDIFSRAYVL